MTEQEAEETFLLRKNLLMKELNSERNKEINVINNETRYELPTAQITGDYIIYKTKNGKNLKRDNSQTRSIKEHKPRILGNSQTSIGNFFTNPNTPNCNIQIFNGKDVTDKSVKNIKSYSVYGGNGKKTSGDKRTN